MKEGKYSPKTIEHILRANADSIFQVSRGTSGEPTDLRMMAKSIYISSMLDVCAKVGLSLSELSIVDVGCSRCEMLLVLRELGAKELFGVNHTPFNFQWLRNHTKFDEYWGDGPGKIRYLECDVDYDRLPFEDCSQSIVFMADVFEHLHNPLNILAESYRVLIEKGLLVIGTPNVANLKNRLYLLTGRSPYCALESWLKKDRMATKFVGHIREYSMLEVKYLISLCGFKLVSKRFFPSDSETHKGVIYQIYKWIERIYPPFSYNMLLIGQKKQSLLGSNQSIVLKGK